MKLLFVTQKMDRNDSVLGAYHGWVAELARRVESVIVICLYEGEHQLPENVTVHSLGKESGEASPLIYAARFLRLAWELREQYDRVFVHMNQEYILIAGPLWKLLGKPVYMWRNHYAGTFLTDIAAAFCTKVFCTSKHSYTAKYRKTVFMPVGIDISRFAIRSSEAREPRSVLFLARISPAKRPDVFIEALGLLIARGVSFIASVYGSPAPEDERYYESLKQRVDALGLHGRVRFHPAVPNHATPPVYRAHEIFVNCSRSGMFDKTLFEAAASGCAVIAASEDWKEAVDAPPLSFTGTPEDLARALEETFAELPALSARSADAVEVHTLGRLVDALCLEMTA